ncbi:MAG: hypothetical protein PHR35_07585 [Kiritimatiellae bacterium]|nr:hypothetical protein [Kiritimatiellia bacterium]
MLDQSYLGRRVFDVLRTLDFLMANGATDVSLIGRGLGSLAAAFAALLHPSRPRVTLINYLPDYERLPICSNWHIPVSKLNPAPIPLRESARLTRTTSAFRAERL